MGDTPGGQSIWESQKPEALPCLCFTGGPEEQWQRAIHERGEAVCPTCNVVTRKTLVGLKKHMEVCHKVNLPSPLPPKAGVGGIVPWPRWVSHS